MKKLTKEDFKRITNDKNGNPRYKIKIQTLANLGFKEEILLNKETREKVIKEYRSIGALKHRSSDSITKYLIFKTYNLSNLVETINNYKIGIESKLNIKEEYDYYLNQLINRKEL